MQPLLNSANELFDHIFLINGFNNQQNYKDKDTKIDKNYENSTSFLKLLSRFYFRYQTNKQIIINISKQSNMINQYNLRIFLK